MPYRIFIEPIALEDIQKAIHYYDEQEIGLGDIFDKIYFTSASPPIGG